ncbi:BREX-2 system phosphatase PglZ [Nocardiopsis sp. CNT312]|uniref:BREX-2 system phosphatase PglZ n=1 Tax=Nocardiopsis sp. CNT312 TaxID=1137268 RepID=UPI00048E6676|nr:BREX-2 system phosphatase PglZ [Nocardiopsis sp. CNT312]
MSSRAGAPRRAALGRVNAEAVRGALERALDAEASRVDRGHPRSAATALALSADPHWDGPDPLTLHVDTGGDTQERTVRVVGADSVLAAVHALARRAEGVDHLVVLTPLDSADFGEALLGRFLGEEVMRLDDWELLRGELKATGIDPRLHRGQWSWLADTLRGIRATHPLRIDTGVLRLEQALSIAVSVRFGRRPGERVDSAALLEWTRDPASVAAFTRLPEVERDELRAALERDLGAVPRVLFTLLDRGHALDAVPVGLALAELAEAADRDAPEAARAARYALIRAQERYFGAQQPGPGDLADFGNACTAALVRLLDGGEDDHAEQTIRRTEELLSQLDAAPVAQASRLLDAGLHARLADLGRQIGLALGPGPDSPPQPQDLPEVEAALVRLREHRRHGARDKQAQALAATDAVRLLRRLALGTAQRPLGEDTPATAHGWIQAHIHQTGWVDRAASALWHHRSDVPAFTQALSDLYHRVRDWRARVDAGFAAAVNRWNSGHAPTDPQLRVENLLGRVARPLVAHQPPLVVVLDGMSAEVAVQLAEDISAGGRLVEIVRRRDGAHAPEREGALATVPSVTTCSRASLLTGRLQEGKQDRERSGFAELWNTPSFGRRRAVLYHQRALETGAGLHLPDTVQRDIDDTDADTDTGTKPGTVVAVVLNTIDDALARGREGDESTWTVRQVGRLGSLLDAAARAGRPVVLTSDHGHVWDRGEAAKTRAGESARHRTGTPEDGEVLATGDRVLAGDGRLVVPYREDIRYTDRKEGYHGGFSAAEMVIPVLVFVPALNTGRRGGDGADTVPQGWQRLDPAQTEPVWWSQPLEGAAPAGQEAAAAPAGAPAAATAAPSPRPGRKRPEPEHTPALFGEEAVAPRTLGVRVTATSAFAASRSRTPRAPEPERFAALIDALAAAGGTHPRLPVGAASRAAGGPESHPRAVRFLKMAGKVLNVEAYPVLTLTDGDRSVELNTALLQQQFPEGS